RRLKGRRRGTGACGYASLISSWSSVMSRQRRGLQDLLERGDSLGDLDGAGDAQRAHAALEGGLRERDEIGGLGDEPLHLARDLQDLVDADAAQVAGVAAFEAAHGAEDVRRRLGLERRDDRIPHAPLFLARER